MVLSEVGGAGIDYALCRLLQAELPQVNFGTQQENLTMLSLTPDLSRLLSTIALVVCTGVPSFAQKNEKSEPEQLLAETLKAEAADYKIELQDGTKTKLTMHPEPVLSWVNPVRYQQQGLVYVWTDQGKARAIGGVFTNYFSDVRMYTSHEFHSLSAVGLRAEHGGKDVWHPKEEGLNFHTLADSPPPAPKKPARLLQMRRLAQEFSAHSINQEGGRYELRLLPAPLFRYQTADEDIHDGAVFSMVSSAGTDPEILLIFEVLDTPQGPRWHYAPARFSDAKLYLQHKDEQVWEFVYPDGVAGYKHEVSAPDRYRLWDNRQFTTAEIALLLKNAKPKEAAKLPH